MRSARKILLGLLGGLGGAGGSTAPTAPVLAMDPLWDTTDNTPSFAITFDATVTAGDDLRLQIQAAGGDWSSLISDTTHDITAPEDVADAVSLAVGTLANGNYEARANVTTSGGTSSWSNAVSFTIAASNAWQLEASTDHWQLEDASGNWILEA